MNNKFKISLICFAAFFVLISRGNTQVRKSYFAGHFYPGDNKSLSLAVDKELASAKKIKFEGEIAAIIVPHAGYSFSAPTAAAAYKNIGNDYKTVVLIGPPHRSYVKGAAVYAKGVFQTPLGNVSVDSKLAKKLIKTDAAFKNNVSAHSNEHSLEVQLPFLQRKLKKGFKIVPILVGDDNAAELVRIGEIIAKVLKGRKALIVISSDFSHYPDHKTAKIVDESAIFSLSAMNPAYFLAGTQIIMDKRIPKLSTVACGRGAIAVGMAAAKVLGANKFVKFKYEDSFDANPSQSSETGVVGYLAGAFLKTVKKPEPFKLKLNAKEEKELLDFARLAIVSELKGEDPKLDISENITFNQPAAVFVTLTDKGLLRGCIGTTSPRMTLRDAVFSFARAAAFSDRRFMPVKLKEIEKIKIEVSILSPLEQINFVKEIIEHKHGVAIVNKDKSGLFLPQVWEQISKKEDFLNEICVQKAELEKKCWLDKNTRLYTFTVDSFEE